MFSSLRYVIIYIPRTTVQAIPKILQIGTAADLEHFDLHGTHGDSRRRDSKAKVQPLFFQEVRFRRIWDRPKKSMKAPNYRVRQKHVFILFRT